MNEGIMDKIKTGEECLWLNPDYERVAPLFELDGKKFVHIKAAQNRFMRFMPYFESAFLETAPKKGVIESKLLDIRAMSSVLLEESIGFSGRLLLKDDAHLPICGSVKARGGIHEVIKHAEELAIKEGLLKNTDNYAILDSDKFRKFFSQYTIQVGSTGNLGLSIGIVSAKLGFNVTVHMSKDAKSWKKELLRSHNVNVVEYEGDYSQAVKEGRRLSEADPYSYFVDDENSDDLFMGYATAALRLKVQLFTAGISVDSKHPLFVYLPCGVGGAPGGITFGLKQMFGSNVHCFFAEPTAVPSLTIGMATGKGNSISVYDIGLSGNTIADGLACATASGLVMRRMKTLLSGTGLVNDKSLRHYQKILMEKEKIFIEPSAAAGFGVLRLLMSAEGKAYLDKENLTDHMENATHIIWATGGGMVPDGERIIL